MLLHNYFKSKSTNSIRSTLNLPNVNVDLNCHFLQRFFQTFENCSKASIQFEIPNHPYFVNGQNFQSK